MSRAFCHLPSALAFHALTVHASVRFIRTVWLSNLGRGRFVVVIMTGITSTALLALRPLRNSSVGAFGILTIRVGEIIQ